MTQHYAHQGVEFEWDDDKAMNNLDKHGVSFETACEVFFDPFVVTLERQNDAGEVRSVIVGMTTY